MRKIQAVLCGAHRWDGREYTISASKLTDPIPVPMEILPTLEVPPPSEVPAGPKVDLFVWDGTVDNTGRHRFRIPVPVESEGE